MSVKKKYQRGTTPSGIAAWPRLTEPDRTFDPNGVYSVNLRLSAEDAESLIATIDQSHVNQVRTTLEELRKKAGNKAKVKESEKPYRPVVDEDGNETGEIEFKFKLKAVAGGKDRQWNQKPRLFDSKGKPLASTTKIGSGSTIKVGYELFPYYVPSVGAGVSRRVLAVQVLELVEFSSGSFKDFGFESENGYEAPAEEEVVASDGGSAQAEEDVEDVNF